MPSKTAVAYIAHDDHHYFAASLRSFHCGLPIYVFLSDCSWIGDTGDFLETERIAKSSGATVISGHWPSEEQHRNAAYDWLRDNGCDYVVTADGDEIIEPGLLDSILKIAEHNLADRVHIEWNTYWRSEEYVIRPREPFRPLMLASLHRAKYERVREFSGGRQLFLNDSYGIVHHMSYAGPDCRILRKITTWGHRNEIRPGWYDRVWLQWPQDKTMRNIHPTHPENYGFAERIEVPEILRTLISSPQLEARDELTVNSGKASPKKRTKATISNVNNTKAAVSSPGNAHVNLIATSGTSQGPKAGLLLPSASVVIPLYGGEDDIARCLRSLQVLSDLVVQTIVVDNGSPDGAAEVAKAFPGVDVVLLGENKGFAAACNAGIKRATAEVVLLLNSDTVVPRAGLIELLKSIASSGSVAAAGPHTNQAGHGQQVFVTYTSLETMGLFAEDFAGREADDREVDMLVGFCLAIKKSALDEVGLLDEEFGFGTWEDNDICYRLRRAGYKLVLSGKSFVHHEASKTLHRMGLDIRGLLEKNRRYFLEKWKLDLETGFASSLPGLGEPVVFRPEKNPDLRWKQIKRLRDRAKISLCMIVRDEERVIGECLESIKPFVKEMIVVDTGSTDRTKEIALEKGAKVFDFPWTNSFSEARNESLRHATGDWIFWQDADDVIDMASGEALLRNAIDAMPHIVGYVVPVRFVDDGPAGGVQVDHVKLFRNLPGVKFEFHIHEQVISSLKARGREIARSSAFVLHKGYDNSPAGQQKKKERDDTLLALDLQENPDHPFVLFNCGMTAHYRDDHEDAVKFLSKCIELAAPGESHVRKAYPLLARSLDQLKRTDEALEKLEEGLKLMPDDPEIHFNLAQILSRQDRLQEARDHYTAVLGADVSSHYCSVDRGIFSFKTLHNRADIDMALGNYVEAKAGWVAAIEAAPTFTPSMFSLFAAALKGGDLPTARQMLDKVRDAEGFSESWCAMAVQYGEFVAGPEDAEERLWQAVKLDRQSVMPRLVLARRFLARGDSASAARLLDSLQRDGVAEGAFHLGVLAEGAHDYQSALRWMSRAEELNPGHIDTLKHLEMLRECLEESA